MSSLAMSGVSTGINWDVLISHTMASYSKPLYRLQDRKNLWESKEAATEEIERRLIQMQDLANDLRNASALRRAVASSSDTSVVQATATDGAGEGTFQIEVNQLATAEREIHAGVASTETWTHGTAVAAAGDEYISADDITDNAGENYQFVFQFGTETQVTVDLSGYDASGITLNQLVGEINSAAGYTAASAVEVNGQYKLRIQAQNNGEGKDLAITDDNSIATLDNTDDFTQTSAGEVGADSLVGAGNFIYTYDGVTRTIVTTASTTLGELRDLINNDGANPGITATVLKYEVDADHVYHLVLTGNNTGEDYDITIDAGTTLTGFGPGANWTEQVAQNAQVRIDGYPAGLWIERDSNSISDLIPNVMLNLISVGTGLDGATITLSRDTGDLKNDLSNLAAIYNGIVDLLGDYAGYNEDTGLAGIFQGDALVTNIQSQIRNPFISTVAGFVDAMDKFTLATHIGLEIGKDGHIELDETVLNDALEEDYYAVLSLIGAIGTGGSDNSFIQFNNADASTTAGVYEVEIDYDAAGAITAARIRTSGEETWRDASVAGSIITGVSGNPEQYIELQGIWDSSRSGTTYTESGEVRVQQGFAGDIYDRLDEMLDAVDGTITIKKEQIDSAVESIDKQIDVQEKRLEQKEERLRKKFARLEATLARLDSQSGAFEALISSLETNKSNK